MYGDTWEAPDDQIPVIMDDGSERYAESLIASCTVGQCWTYEKDSDAMWRIYSPDRQGEIENCWKIPVVGFGININTFIKSITFDPRADTWFVDTMKKYCQSKGLSCPTENLLFMKEISTKKLKFLGSMKLLKRLVK